MVGVDVVPELPIGALCPQCGASRRIACSHVRSPQGAGVVVGALGCSCRPLARVSVPVFAQPVAQVQVCSSNSSSEDASEVKVEDADSGGADRVELKIDFEIGVGFAEDDKGKDGVNPKLPAEGEEGDDNKYEEEEAPFSLGRSVDCAEDRNNCHNLDWHWFSCTRIEGVDSKS